MNDRSLYNKEKAIPLTPTPLPRGEREINYTLSLPRKRGKFNYTLPLPSGERGRGEGEAHGVFMTNKINEDKLRSRIKSIQGFYKEQSRMPTFSEIGEIVGIKSKNAVSKLVTKLEFIGVVGKDAKGRLYPRAINHTLRILGTVEAGFPSPAEEELCDTISLDDMLINNKEASFILKVSGNSMIEAGIMPDDMVIVEKGKTPKTGDIVIAEVDGEWTMKYLQKRGNSVSLLPANPKFKPIKPKNKLRIAGVVTSVVRKYG